MNMLNAVCRVFGSSKQEGPRNAQSDRDIVRGIVGCFSERNVSLQTGQYITQEDIAQVRDEILQHNFRKEGAAQVRDKISPTR